MKLSFQQKGNYQYAKIPGESYRKDGKVLKRNTVYLGRVIDAEHNIFYNKDRGVFTFDPETGEYGKADESYLGLLTDDRRKSDRLILDFGDSFFVDSLLKQMKYDQVIQSIDYKNADTLKTMIAYYILTNQANRYAQTWYEGSFASVLYPNADLHSQRISDFLETLGKEAIRRKYFKAHIDWVKENVCIDPAIILDSTGLPNSINVDMTQVSNHNGVINNEVRMVTAVQRDSGYPLMFRAVPGNIVDVATLSTTVATLKEYDVDTDLALLDAGYFSAENADNLYASHIDFVSRLPERNKTLYKEILDAGAATLKEQKNLIKYNGRYVYIKRINCKVGNNQNDAYAYLCYDVGAGNDEVHEALKRARKKKTTDSSMHEVFRTSGYFILISSLPFQCSEILEVYYTRQSVEQYFDIGKGLARLIPLRVHSEARILGHLLLSQIAATVNLYIQKTMKEDFASRDQLFMALRNQKCIVYSNRILMNEGQSNANRFYDQFKIQCPLFFEKNGNKVKPNYRLVSDSNDVDKK